MTSYRFATASNIRRTSAGCSARGDRDQRDESEQRQQRPARGQRRCVRPDGRRQRREEEQEHHQHERRAADRVGQQPDRAAGGPRPRGGDPLSPNDFRASSTGRPSAIAQGRRAAAGRLGGERPSQVGAVDPEEAQCHHDVRADPEHHEHHRADRRPRLRRRPDRAPRRTRRAGDRRGRGAAATCHCVRTPEAEGAGGTRLGYVGAVPGPPARRALPVRV